MDIITLGGKQSKRMKILNSKVEKATENHSTNFPKKDKEKFVDSHNHLFPAGT